jgi:hypothetical protein
MAFRTTPKFTYLIGAGASAQALPLAKNFDANTTSLGTRLRTIGGMMNPDLLEQYSVREKFESLFEDFRLISKESDSFGTIDTLAKYYFLTDQTKYLKLKNTLSTFFSIEQLINKKLDNRYLSFITSICDHKIFPTNVNIISWNYDFQFQLAYFKLFGPQRVHKSPNGVTVSNTNGFSYYPSSGNYFSLVASNFESNFNLVQLNGIAGFNIDESKYWAENIFLSSNEQEFKNYQAILEFHENSMLSFAWESHDSTHPLNKRIEIAKKIVIETDYLIIIGYSFPFFNRSIDSEIFKALIEKGTLKKIFFQDPYSKGEYLRGQFNLPDSLIIEPIWKDQFHIPYEF